MAGVEWDGVRARVCADDRGCVGGGGGASGSGGGGGGSGSSGGSYSGGGGGIGTSPYIAVA